jgi:hypothetical protein
VGVANDEASVDDERMEHGSNESLPLERPSRPDELDEQCAALVADWLAEAADLLHNSAIVAEEVEWSSDLQAWLSEVCDCVSKVVDDLPTTKDTPPPPMA